MILWKLNIKVHRPWQMSTINSRMKSMFAFYNNFKLFVSMYEKMTSVCEHDIMLCFPCHLRYSFQYTKGNFRLGTWYHVMLSTLSSRLLLEDSAVDCDCRQWSGTDDRWTGPDGACDICASPACLPAARDSLTPRKKHYDLCLFRVRSAWPVCWHCTKSPVDDYRWCYIFRCIWCHYDTCL